MEESFRQAGKGALLQCLPPPPAPSAGPLAGSAAVQPVLGYLQVPSPGGLPYSGQAGALSGSRTPAACSLSAAKGRGILSELGGSSPAYSGPQRCPAGSCLTRSSASLWLAWKEVACSLRSWARVLAAPKALLLCCSRSCNACSSVCSWARAASCRSSCGRDHGCSQWAVWLQAHREAASARVSPLLFAAGAASGPDRGCGEYSPAESHAAATAPAGPASLPPAAPCWRACSGLCAPPLAAGRKQRCQSLCFPRTPSLLVPACLSAHLQLGALELAV